VKARAPKCTGYLGEQCRGRARVMNAYAVRDYPREGYKHHHDFWCRRCERQARGHWATYPHWKGDVLYDRYETLLFAEVGDELWIALDHAWLTLAGDRDGTFDNAADNERARGRARSAA
jgi:hypothetical protein